ncbi:glycosyltransferase [Victivallis sp. Marseille-Q1083]|uniref:glycosyltransferase n=1 Tax=Victivallis sp. Marseille-Q1083 TaxID=2717288 RepID=UPI001588E232|nr:glycosyltransferase [Victivallis sp. Marseille-Q1083]
MNHDSKQVAIVIVTYNRLANLQTLLNAFLSMPEYREPTFFLVDNASTDGTAAYLNEQAAGHANYRVLRLPENSGGAGGFHAGVKAAYEAGFEWLWIMDDDVIPLPGALETLLRYADCADCIQGAKQFHDGSEVPFEGRLDPRTMRRRFIYRSELADGGYVPCNCATFEGLFFHRRVVEKLGPPDREFFIGLDDLFYGFKISEFFKFIYIKEWLLRKQFEKERLALGKRRFYSSSLFGRYFHLRNYWFVMNYLKKRRKLSALAYLTYSYESAKALALTLLFERDWKGAGILLAAIRHGRRGDVDSYRQIFFNGAKP